MVVYTIDMNIYAKDNGCEFDEAESLDYTCHRKRTGPVPGEDKGAKRSGPIRALAINTCPRKDKGDVAALLDPFLEGMKEAGAEVELHYARDLTIFPCCGNLNCTVRTPGNCMAYDDMRGLRQKIGQADVLVLASPLYYSGIVGPEGATGSLRSLLGRLTPGKLPSADVPYEHAVHTTREAVNLRKIVFASGCGFWEIDGLYPVLTHIKALCYNTFPEFAGNITGAHGVLLRGALERGMAGSDIREISRKAGVELANDGNTSPEDLAKLVQGTRAIYGRIIGQQEL